MTDVFGNELGFHPIYVIEADSEKEALQKWLDMPWHDRGLEGVIAKEIRVE